MINYYYYLLPLPILLLSRDYYLPLLQLLDFVKLAYLSKDHFRLHQIP